MEQDLTSQFWNIQASDVLSALMAVAVLSLAYGLIRGAQSYFPIQAQYSAIVLISGVLGILVFLKSTDKIGEDGLIGILGSLIGYVLGSLRPMTNHGHGRDKEPEA